MRAFLFCWLLFANSLQAKEWLVHVSNVTFKNYNVDITLYSGGEFGGSYQCSCNPNQNVDLYMGDVADYPYIILSWVDGYNNRTECWTGNVGNNGYLSIVTYLDGAGYDRMYVNYSGSYTGHEAAGAITYGNLEWLLKGFFFGGCIMAIGLSVRIFNRMGKVSPDL